MVARAPGNLLAIRTQARPTARDFQVDDSVAVRLDQQNGVPHAHPGMEQVCYLLEGTALVELDGERCEMQPGDACYFPAGKMHKFTATSEKPAKVLVIYSPPYGESPEKIIR